MSRRLDSHQHFWRYDAVAYSWIDDSMQVLARDWLPADLRPELDAAGIDGCIAVQARQSLEENRFLLALAAASPWIAGVVGWVDLQAANVAAQLQEFATDRRFVGVRHIAQSEPDPRFLVGEPFVRGMRALRPFDLTYDLLVLPPQLPAAIELVQLLPEQRFVLDHLGKPELKAGRLDGWRRDLQRLAARPNVACKLSGLVTEADWSHWTPATLAPVLDAALQAFGPERLLFGSDWPVMHCASTYARWNDVLESWLQPLAAAEQVAIRGENCARWYRLPTA